MGAPGQLQIKVEGIDKTQLRLATMGRAASMSMPAMVMVSNEMLRIERATFDSEGRRGGGSWARDTDAWMISKQRRNLDPRIGHARLALRDSVSQLGAPNQILRLTPKSVTLGSHLPYAATEQKHRPFLKFTASDREKMNLIISEYLKAVWDLAVIA